MSESGAVDPLKKEAMGKRVECIGDVHRYGGCSVTRLALVKVRDHNSRNRKQGRGGGVPLFEAVLGGACSQRLQDAMEGAASVSPVPGKAARWGSRSGPVHTASQIKIMTEFFQIDGMSTPATDV